MSNANNLSTLANVLDNGSSGEFLKSTGSGGVAFDTVAAGATVYSSVANLPLTGNTVGDMAYVSAATTAKVVNQTTGSVSTEDATRLYIYSGTGWYSVAFITQNPTINTVQDAGSNTTPFTLATDGTTATVVTITANDPESVPLTYSYSVTDGSLNGCTVTGADGTSARVAGTAYTDNVFTVTPHASNDATFTITFTASDGINQATSENAFSLSFITTVTDSKYTTLLATATGTSDNNNITDSSSNSHSITVNGDSTAGTFSPYRSGGYAINFGSSASLKFAEGSTSDFNMGTNAFTIEMWIRPATTSSGSKRFFHNRISGMANGRGHIFQNGSNLYATYRGDNGTDYELSVSGVLTAETWTHVCFLRNTSDNTLKLYYNGILGQSVSVPSTVGIYNSTSNTNVGLADFGDIANLRVVNGTAITPTSSSILEKPTNVTNTVLLMIGGNFVDYSGNAPQINNYYGPPQIKAYGPLDYTEYSATDNGGSVYFDGSGDYLTIPSSNDFQLGTTGTINFWMYLDKTSNAGIVSGYNNANSLFIYCQNNFNLEWRDNNNAYYSATGIELFQKVWTYVSIVRSGTTLKVYLNGVEKASQPVSSTSEFGSDENLEIGNRSAIGWTYKGYLSDFQIIKGTAIVPTPSTVPIAPSATHSNSKLHLKGTDASIIDKSQVNNIVMNGPTTGSTTKSAFGSEPTISFASGSNSSRYLEFDPTVLEFMEILGDPSIPFTIEGIWGWQGSTAAPIFEIYQDNNNFFYFGAGRNGTTNGVTTSVNCHGIFKIGGTEKFNLGGNTGSYNVVGSSFKHQAITRNSSGLIQHWYNGSASSNTATHSGTSTVSWASPTGYIGGSQIMGSTYGRLEGYIHQVRLTVGKARYTTNFPAPTSSFEG